MPLNYLRDDSKKQAVTHNDLLAKYNILLKEHDEFLVLSK
jgi:hypothetical protein